MGGMTSYLQKKILDSFLAITPYTMPTALYLSLHTASPTDTGSFLNEVTTVGTGYVRQLITGKMAATDATSGISISNVTITFPTILVEYGVVSHIGISDALTAGNMCMWGALSEPQTKTVGGAYQFTLGQVSIQLN